MFGAPSKGGAARGARRTSSGVWAAALASTILTVWAAASSSCSELPDYGAPGGGTPASTGTVPVCVGPTCPEACAVHPVPGCACDVEGQHLQCGKADSSFPDGRTVCGQGVSTCTDHVWAECVINGAVTLPPADAPAGYYAEGYGSATDGGACAYNPCDPGCIDYPDTPGGLSNDAGITATDAGVTLSGDGGLQCVKKSCADLGRNCGPASDGCGGILNCGTCGTGQSCGAGGTPGVCAAGASCTNLCLNQVTCAGTATTSVSGVVYMPNGTTPLPNVTVYVPNAGVTPFPAHVACETSATCGAGSGSPLVLTTSALDGTFTLTNVPVGVSFPLVMQLGHFRRQVTIPAIPMPGCTNLDLTKINGGTCKAIGSSCTKASDCCSNSCSSSNGGAKVCDPITRFPKNQGEGDIPKMAFVTGSVDSLECVWRKVGIDDSEFTNPSGTGRINFFQGGYSPGAYIGSSGTQPSTNATHTREIMSGTGSSTGTPWEDALLGSPSTLNNYDIILFPCQGGQMWWDKQTTFETNLANWVNAGGRMFTTHYSYVYQYSDASDVGSCGKDGTSCSADSSCCSRNCSGGKCASAYSSPLSPAINWAINLGNPTPDPGTGLINTSFQKGKDLSQWLLNVGASTTYGQIPINTLRQDFASVNAPTQLWMNVNDPPACTPKKCGKSSCGPMSDGCGNLLLCGSCTSGQYCGGGGTANVCSKTNKCSPKTCAQQGITCGKAGDGCGNTIDCGACAQTLIPMEATYNTPLGVSASSQCGRVVHSDFHVENSNNSHYSFPSACTGGAPSAQEFLLMDMLFDLASCVTPDAAATCVPQTCAQQGQNCGPGTDGCGNTLNCGTCVSPATCGGAGIPNVCGVPNNYSDAYFTRDYDASTICPSGTAVTWRLYSWQAITPSDSTIEFTIQTAATSAGLPTATSYQLLFSAPPLTAGDPLIGQWTIAHGGSPDTEVDSASPDLTLLANSVPQNNQFLRVTAHLVPSTDRNFAPTLVSWDMQVDCTQNQ